MCFPSVGAVVSKNRDVSIVERWVDRTTGAGDGGKSNLFRHRRRSRSRSRRTTAARAATTVAIALERATRHIGARQGSVCGWKVFIDLVASGAFGTTSQPTPTA